MVVAVAMHTMDIVITLVWPVAVAVAAAALAAQLQISVPVVPAAAAAAVAQAARRIGGATLTVEFIM